MRKIKYYEVIKRIESSTPIDTPDTYYSKGKFENEKDACELKDKLEKELHEEMKKKYPPPWGLLHTEYFVKHGIIELK